MKIIFECNEDEASNLLLAKQKYSEALEEHFFQERLRCEQEELMPQEIDEDRKIGFRTKGE
jgi:hypothetical protein